MRTIFFNGPKGHRWVSTAVPTDENPDAPPPSPQIDEARSRSPAFLRLPECDARQTGAAWNVLRQCAGVLCETVRERINEKSEGRTEPLPFGGVCRLYEALIVERAIVTGSK